jgi:hypothetical protein
MRSRARSPADSLESLEDVTDGRPEPTCEIVYKLMVGIEDVILARLDPALLHAKKSS